MRVSCSVDVAKMPVAVMTSESQVYTATYSVCWYVRVNMYGDYVVCVLQAILQEIVQGLNIEKVLPSYKYSITSRSATLLCSRYTQCMLTVCVCWYGTVVLLG